MEYDRFEILRFIQRNSKSNFEALIKVFPSKPELIGSLNLLVNEKYTDYDRGIYEINKKGANKLKEMDEEKRLEKSLGKNQMELIIKQKDFIDIQLKNYPLFKKLTISAFIISLH
jgi:hypothetical protein